MISTKSVSVIVDFKVYLYLFEPIIESLSKENYVINLYIPDELVFDAKNVFCKNDSLIINSLTHIKKKNKFRFAIHRVLLLLFTRTDFSFQFKKKREQTTKKFTGTTGFLLKLSRFTPKISNKSINKFLSSITGTFFKNPFKDNIIIVGSLNASAELLSAKHQKIVTVMESWDHAVKEPNGYTSTLFLGWNKLLCHDWKMNQFDNNTKEFYPLKLRYAREVVKQQRILASNNEGRRFKVLYPVASTRKFSIGVLCDIEERLIAELAKICKQLNWDLHIKPRPNGMIGEFDYLNHFSHVTVGHVSHGDINNPANYFFSDVDNAKRFQEVLDSDLVINAFTTFGLDCAAAGVPVLQLDLRLASDFLDSSVIYNNHHIKQYLINTDSLIRPDGECFFDYFINCNKDLVKIAEKYTEEMNQWLFNFDDTNSALTEFNRIILNLIENRK